MITTSSCWLSSFVTLALTRLVVRVVRGLHKCIMQAIIHPPCTEHQLKAQDKNGHILPTGQWYAPPAVINDEWYCMILHGIALYCIVLHGIAWYCMVLHGIAWYCMVLHGIA